MNTALFAYVALQQGHQLEEKRRRRDVSETDRIRRRRSLPRR